MELLHKDLSEQILKNFYDVYNELGFGFLEKEYAKPKTAPIIPANTMIFHWLSK